MTSNSTSVCGGWDLELYGTGERAYRTIYKDGPYSPASEKRLPPLLVYRVPQESDLTVRLGSSFMHGRMEDGVTHEMLIEEIRYYARERQTGRDPFVETALLNLRHRLTVQRNTEMGLPYNQTTLGTVHQATFCYAWDRMRRKVYSAGTPQTEVLIGQLPPTTKGLVMLEIIRLFMAICPVTGEPGAWVEQGYVYLPTVEYQPVLTSATDRLRGEIRRRYSARDLQSVYEYTTGLLLLLFDDEANHCLWNFRENAERLCVGWDHYTSTGLSWAQEKGSGG